ncbi:MAG: membrane-bound lytic murein transglycosylase D [Arcticibacterium sp.]|jgi:membrane-bound lytic murein transglycosylase D
MNLRAFLINQIEPLSLKKARRCLFVFCLMLSYARANGQVQLPKIPYEIEFADVTFQLNDASRFLLREEVRKMENDKVAKEEALEALALFLPEVSQKLRNSVIPQDFKFLVLYNKYQVNIAQTSYLERGVFWCLTKDLATDLDLNIDFKIDERKNFFIATDGAMIGFRRNNVLYNNWGTTLFSQLVSREVINLIGVNKDWNGKKYMVLDGPAYSSVLSFLAFKMVIEASLPTFRPVEERVIYRYSYGSLKDLNVIAADLRVSPLELKESNLWLKGNYIPETDIPVLVIVPAVRYNNVRILAEISSNTGFPIGELGFPVLVADHSLALDKGGSFYRINGKRGIKADFCDSYVTLSYKADVSIKNFLAYNDMTEQDVTSIGQVYYLESKDNKGPIKKHITREGERLWDISMLYGIALDDLLKYNRLENIQDIQRGRVVLLQEKRPKNALVEYVKIERKIAFEDSLNDDPILGVALYPEKPAELMPNTVEELVEGEPEDDVIVLADSGVVAKEIEVKPMSQKSYSKTLKEHVLGVKEEVKEEPKFVIHTVKRGETLYRISVNYRVSVKQLYRLNSLRSNIIEIGDKIKVKSI